MDLGLTAKTIVKFFPLTSIALWLILLLILHYHLSGGLNPQGNIMIYILGVIYYTVRV